jgi:prepilin-type N-terminal cleavage/methylation domain-containing protein
MPSPRGFSLVELSVVIVIIGLLAAAVMGGAELLRSMRMKSMAALTQDYKGALTQFSSIYQGLPGDLVNATQYFDADSLPSPSRGTCDNESIASVNGDGDGKIEPGQESALANLHLSLAEIAKHVYCGAWSGTYDVGVNVIESKVAKGAAMRIVCCGSSDYARAIAMKNHFEFFSVSPLNAGEREGVLAPKEARDVDYKFDDGNPDAGFVAASGKFTGSGYAKDGCYSGEADSAAYLVGDASKDADKTSCRMLFAYD